MKNQSCLTPFRRFYLFLCLISLCLTSSFAATSNLENEKWLIRGKGVGHFNDKNPPLKNLLQAYPNLKVSANRKALRPLIWRDLKTINAEDVIDAEPYLSFSENGKELMRAWCDIYCTANRLNKVDLDKNKLIHLEESVEVSLVFVNPKFHTSKNIRVGSTLRQLIAAYPHLKNTLQIYQFSTLSTVDFDEEVCFKPEGNLKKEDVHFLSFTVRPIKKNKLVGYYNKEKYITTKMDFNAKIIAITNGYECNPEEATHVG